MVYAEKQHTAAHCFIPSDRRCTSRKRGQSLLNPPHDAVLRARSGQFCVSASQSPVMVGRAEIDGADGGTQTRPTYPSAYLVSETGNAVEYSSLHPHKAKKRNEWPWWGRSTMTRSKAHATT